MEEPEKNTAMASSLGINHNLDASAEHLHGNLRQHDSGFGWSAAYSRVLQFDKPARLTSFCLPMLSSIAVPVADFHSEHCFDGRSSNLHSGNCSLWRIST